MAIKKDTLTNFYKDSNIKLSEAIEIILSIRTTNTAKTYRNVYKHFFLFTFNKKLEEVTWRDLKTLTYTDVLEFISFCEIKFSYNTIKTIIGALQALCKELNKIKLNCVNTSIFSVRLNQKIKKNSTYGAFTENEAYNLLKYTKNLNTQKSTIQYLFFKTIIVTAHRVNSLLSIRWKDIKKVSEDGVDIWVINVYDKTNYFQTPISNELFFELKTNLFKDNQEDFVFDISEKSLSNTLSKYCKLYNIDKENRNLVIHSLKKTSADIAFKKTNNIVQVAKHLKHTNINTAYTYYLDRNNKLSNCISYNMLKENNPIEELKIEIKKANLNEEMIIELMAEICGVGTVYNILNFLKGNRYYNKKNNL